MAWYQSGGLRRFMMYTIRPQSKQNSEDDGWHNAMREPMINVYYIILYDNIHTASKVNIPDSQSRQNSLIIIGHMYYVTQSSQLWMCLKSCWADRNSNRWQRGGSCDIEFEAGSTMLDTVAAAAQQHNMTMPTIFTNQWFNVCPCSSAVLAVGVWLT